VLPQDLVVTDGADVDEPLRVDGVDVPDNSMALDIGPRTAARYAAEIAVAATVFWNGPMGRFELPPFATGTRAIAAAAASTRATTVVGGGETVEAMRSFGLQDRVSHLSTGGGATLEFLEGRELPGVRALLRMAAAAR
jgi:phosphoglycerate kinase